MVKNDGEYIKREDAHKAIEQADTGYCGSEGHVIYADDAHGKINAIPFSQVTKIRMCGKSLGLMI